eukprot:5634219-Prymnesium_polylepis.2
MLAIARRCLRMQLAMQHVRRTHRAMQPNVRYVPSPQLVACGLTIGPSPPEPGGETTGGGGGGGGGCGSRDSQRARASVTRWSISAWMAEFISAPSTVAKTERIVRRSVSSAAA